MARISGSTILLMVLAVSTFSEEVLTSSCCRKYSRMRIPAALIRGFSVQTIQENCHIPAVIFHTQSGRNICTDPSKAWVMENIRKLRNELRVMKKNRKQIHSKASKRNHLW